MDSNKTFSREKWSFDRQIKRLWTTVPLASKLKKLTHCDAKMALRNSHLSIIITHYYITIRQNIIIKDQKICCRDIRLRYPIKHSESNFPSMFGICIIWDLTVDQGNPPVMIDCKAAFCQPKKDSNRLQTEEKRRSLQNAMERFCMTRRVGGHPFPCCLTASF